MKQSFIFLSAALFILFIFSCRENNDIIRYFPDLPSNPSPANAATGIEPAQQMLTWTCNDRDGDELRFNIYFSLDNPPSSLLDTNISSTTYELACLESNTSFFWQVIATDPGGLETKGPIWHFTTMADFRDPFIGDYLCMCTYIYLCSDSTILTSCTDTVSYDAILNISKSGDSSIMVFREGDAYSDYSFIGHYLGDNYFECLECNGPPDYARFYGTDSIMVFRKSGVTNFYMYYGKKQPAKIMIPH